MFRSLLNLPLAFCLFVLGCGSEGGEDTNENLTRVTFATDWVAQAEHGGFYMAQALGLYEARGLDVEIRPGGASVNIPQLLATGAVDFAMGSNSFIPLNIVRAGVPAKGVMATFQKDPQVLITHPRDDVNTLADMRGKPIMISDATRSTWWPWLEAQFGFTQDQIRKYTASVAPFLVNPTAIQQGYITSEPYLIERELGEEPEVYLLADYGYPSYATIVMTRVDTIESQPAVVQAFVDASIEGWKRYLEEDPAPAHALIRRDNPDMDPDILEQAHEKLIRFEIVKPAADSGLRIGAMTDTRWRDFFTQMAKAGLYETSLDYRQAFTLQFVTSTPSGGPSTSAPQDGTQGDGAP